MAIHIASQKKAGALQERFRHGSNLSLPEEIPCLRLCENVYSRINSAPTRRSSVCCALQERPVTDKFCTCPKKKFRAGVLCKSVQSQRNSSPARRSSVWVWFAGTSRERARENAKGEKWGFACASIPHDFSGFRRRIFER